MHINESRSLGRVAAQRKGFTLVEVVIALAIFVFGALAIIRIFPPALGVIQNSGDRLVGSNLNKSLLARYDKSPELVPDAIYDADRKASSWADPNDPGNTLYGSVAGSRRNRSIPRQSGLAGFDWSALARYKNIVGERHTVPASKLVYTQFPYVTRGGTDPMPKAYIEDTLSGVTIDPATKQVLFANAIFDSNGAKYTPADGDIAYISYRWLENGRYWAIQEDRILMSGTTDKFSINQASRTGVTLFAQGEIKVRLRQLAPMPTISADDPLIGLIDFNKLAAGTTLAAGTKISLDYEVRDWRSLVVDTVPAAAPNAAPDGTPAPDNVRVVNLPVRLLDTEVAPFILTVYPTQPTTTSEATPVAVDPELLSSYDDEYSKPEVAKTGSIPFVVNPKVTTAPTARIVYRTSENWTQQLSVAAKHYTLYHDDTSTPQDEYWRQCLLVPGASPTPYLYFHPSEAGKTVLVSYSYENPLGGTAPDIVVDNQLLTIDTDIINPLPTGVTNLNLFAGSEGSVARLQFVAQDGSDLDRRITAITKIQGVGIQSRVAWIDGDRFTQVSATRIREGSTQ
jgi:prepilin-type N-terminal cleavage/methylation domain-containing protein